MESILSYSGFSWPYRAYHFANNKKGRYTSQRAVRALKHCLIGSKLGLKERVNSTSKMVKLLTGILKLLVI